MIGIFRKLSLYSNATRYAQYSAIRLCSNRSDQPDDVPKPIRNFVENELETSSKFTSFVPKKDLNTKYSINFEENNTSVLKLLESLPSNPKERSVKTLNYIYDEIRGKYLITRDLTFHPKFRSLRKATKILLPKLNTKEVKNIFVALLPSKYLMNDLNDSISDHVVFALIDRINSLPFDQILYLDFMIRKLYDLRELNKSHIALRLKLQTIFLLKIDHEFDGLEDFKKIMRILAYYENNVEIVSKKNLNTMTTALLLSDDAKFSPVHMTSILIFLSNFGKLDEHVQKLLHKTADLWCWSSESGHISVENVQALFRVLNFKRVDQDMFKDTDFIRCCVDIVIQKNDKSALFAIQNSFNGIGFISESLIDCLSKYFQSKESVRQLTVSDYIVMCRACYKANYRPDNWKSHIIEALTSFDFSLYLSTLKYFDWAEFALNLQQLGYIDTRLIQTILNSKYLQKHQNYDEAKLNKLREILYSDRYDNDNSAYDSDNEHESLWNIDDNDAIAEYESTPLYNDLKCMFGQHSFIWRNFQIDSKLMIPYILKMDLKTGDFLPIFEEPSLHSSKDLLIGIIVIDKDSKRNKMKDAKVQSYRMARNGISSIIIEQSKWDTLKNYEKSLVFYTKVVKMMEIYRGKQLAENH